MMNLPVQFQNLGISLNEKGYYVYDTTLDWKQAYHDYTEEDFNVWKLLYERQMQQLPHKATQAFLDGIEILHFSANEIPKFEQINLILKQQTGWQLHVVPGLLPNQSFFELMLKGKFCATTWFRKLEEIDYLEEPDMFHDVFGHVPLLTNQPLCDFLKQLSRIALKHIDNEAVIEAVARLYWYTIEFGLIEEADGLRIYGAGILSSFAETDYSLLSDVPQRLPFHVETMMNTPYIKDRFQEQYFVIQSFEQLYESIEEIERRIDEK
jgi:phenylalanine-4-hydroxylase